VHASCTACLVSQVCGNQKLLDQFVESNKLLDSVQKGLADYLETKRLAFSRQVKLAQHECQRSRQAGSAQCPKDELSLNCWQRAGCAA
jgi:hypothetical protein